MIQQTSTAKMMQANYSDTATLFAAAVQQVCSSSATSLQ
jgi:hypothetical protein